MSTENMAGGHTVSMTPPAAPAPDAGFGGAGASGAPGSFGPARSGGAAPTKLGPVSIALAVVGGMVVVGTVATAVGFAFFANGPSWIAVGPDSGGGSSTSVGMSASAAGVTELDLNLQGADVAVSYSDVAQIEITIDGPDPGGWTAVTDNGTFTLTAPAVNWGDDVMTPVRVELPTELSQVDLDADISLNAGMLHVDGGRFGELELDLSAGDMAVTGEANTVDARGETGTMSLDLADVDTAVLDMQLGQLTATLTGSTPTSVDVTVNGGVVDLVLPDDVYDYSQTGGLAAVTSELRTAASASHSVTVRANAGAVTVMPG